MAAIMQRTSLIQAPCCSSASKDEDEQMTRLLKEEEAQISCKILTLRKDVSTEKLFQYGAGTRSNPEYVFSLHS